MAALGRSGRTEAELNSPWKFKVLIMQNNVLPLEYGFDQTNSVLCLPLTGYVASGQLVVLYVLQFLRGDIVHEAQSLHQEWRCTATLKRWAPASVPC